MKANGLAHLGRDAELRYSTGGTSVVYLSLAFDYGRRDPASGKRPTQWVNASLWGERAKALAPHLKKGMPVVVWLKDLHIRNYQGSDGPRSTLSAEVEDIELLPRASGTGADETAPSPSPAPARAAATATAGAATGFDDMDHDTPFVSPHAAHDPLTCHRKAARTRCAR